MRILLVTMQFGRSYTQGTERYVATLASVLRGRGHEVGILAGDPLRQDRPRQLGECVDDKQRLHAYPTRGWMAVMGLPPGRLESFLHQWRPDVVHLNTPAHIGVGIALAARRLGIPLVVTAHDFWWTCPKGTLRRGDGGICDGTPGWEECLRCMGADHHKNWVRRLAGARRLPAVALLPLYWARAAGRGMSPADMARWLNRREFLGHVLAAADAVICPSKTIHNILVGPAPRPGWRIIRNGIAAEWFTSGDADAPKIKPPAELVVGFAGALAPHKGPHLLLEAIDLLGWRETRVRIAGPTSDPSYQARLGEVAKEFRIEFLGNLSPAGMRDFLRTLDVFAVTSLWLENCPYVVLEAQAAGVTVVGPTPGGVAELVRDPGLQYAMGSARGLADALEYARTHPSGSCPADVPTEEQMADATEEVYRHVCKPRGCA